MPTLVPNSPQRDSSSFRKVVDAFLSRDGLPFADILSAGRIARIFAKHDCQFGQHGIYTAAIMVWSFLSQVLRDGKEASCQSAVARVVSHCQQQGLPIARAVAIVSLATACVMDLAMGPYKGKETGETALLRSILGSLAAGDIAVMDRYYCSFMMIALLLAQGTHTCARKHHLRHSDFRRGKRLGKYDHLIIWTRPERPEWMDEETYAQIPETLELREIRYNIVEPGRRTRSIDIITTLVDADEYTKEDIADLFGFRWNSELDIRSIKSSLNLGHVRCKSPEMVHREVWTTILGYNLIRTTAAAAALLHDKQPRQISFTSTCQYILASWMQLSGGLIDETSLEEYLLLMLKQIAACEVANRPGRLEPRVLKRRRHGYKLMQKPRAQLRAELRKTCT